MEQQHGGELAELDEIAMVSGQPPGEEDKARRNTETEATEQTGKNSVLKKLDQNQQLSQGGTAL